MFTQKLELWLGINILFLLLILDLEWQHLNDKVNAIDDIKFGIWR